MDLRPFTALASNNWVDLELAAEYAALPVDVLVQAVTARKSAPSRRTRTGRGTGWCRSPMSTSGGSAGNW